MNAPPRRLRLALRGFPRRFRAARSREIVATFEEAELAGDRRPYGMRPLADVVVSGWMERSRTHPPLGHYLKYRLLDGRLDPRWHQWMLDDVHGWYGLRRVAWGWLLTVVPLMLMVLLQVGIAIPDAGFVMAYLVVVSGVVVVSLLLTPLYRRRVLRRHGYDPDTLDWVPPRPWATARLRSPP